MQSLATLRGSDDPRYQAEYHWRLATVVITLVLGLLAVPIARLRPRQGRYARVIWGVLLYAVYANLLISGRTLIEKGTVPAWLGLWWVHALMLLLGIGIVKLPRVTDALRRLRARNANRATATAG
jgi:lipopolysaccharide export system permease protein